MKKKTILFLLCLEPKKVDRNFFTDFLTNDMPRVYTTLNERFVIGLMKIKTLHKKGTWKFMLKKVWKLKKWRKLWSSQKEMDKTIYWLEDWIKI